MTAKQLLLFDFEANTGDRNNRTSTMPPKPKKKSGPSLFDEYLDEPAAEPPASFAERVGEKAPAATFAERVRPTPSIDPTPEPVAPLPDPVPEVVRGPPLANGEKSKARDIIAAIRTLHQVEQRGTPATPEERDALSRFCGFGPVALSLFPNPANGEFKPGWQELGEELKSLLTPQEYDSAKRTTFSQFFTSPTVMAGMHQALTRLGVSEGAAVLEPGCGIGNFMTGHHRYVGVELDSVTGRIGRLLHPGADIRIENFCDSKLPPLDAVIGNVPFANVHLDFHGRKLSLHDFCIAKSVEALKTGGILAVVSSHFTLDKQNAGVRELLADQADFLGAIRLPNDAFKAQGTGVRVYPGS